jgi:hypothetical protein
MGEIFLSYSRDSAALVENLAKDIKALGYSVWSDRELTGGQDWWSEILGRVRACDVFVFALTPQSLDSVACTREYGYAAALRKPILPVLLSGISTNLLPPALAKTQHVDYRSQDREAGFRLARAIKDLPSGGTLPDPLPTPPAVPTSYLGGLAEQISNPSLSLPEQTALLFHLKRGLNENETAVDARKLLTQLRKRPDLYALIAQDIDSIGAATPTAQPRTPESAPAAPTRLVETGLGRDKAEAAQKESIAREEGKKKRQAAQTLEQERLTRKKAGVAGVHRLPAQKIAGAERERPEVRATPNSAPPNTRTSARPSQHKSSLPPSIAHSIKDDFAPDLTPASQPSYLHGHSAPFPASSRDSERQGQYGRAILIPDTVLPVYSGDR